VIARSSLQNITTERVGKQAIGQSVIVNGTVTIDEEQSEVISSRAAGRVEKLYIKETGQPVTKGQPLYTLYSEALLTLQQEYLLAKEQYETLGKSEQRYKSFLDASVKKIAPLWIVK
jgi:Cu(I)/Ag(I) efflux system membrane fusion protein